MIVINAMNITITAFSMTVGYAFGFVVFIFMLLLTIYCIICGSIEYHKLIFDKHKVIFVFKDKERFLLE